MAAYLATKNLKKQRQAVDVLIENKVTFAAENAELSIYDTYQDAQKVALHSSELLFCGMISGKKIMHVGDCDYHKEFLPQQSFVLAPEQSVLIDFPEASIKQPTTCLAIEISRDKISQVADALNLQQHISSDDFFHYIPKLVHGVHNQQTQQLLERMVGLFSENEQDRPYLIELSINELITRLLQQQSRDLMLANCQTPVINSALNYVVNHIADNLNQPLDIEILCKIACMSRSKFYQQFKLAFGLSPAAYQQQLRLKKARKLLQSGLQVSQICYQLGFSNPSHFSRLFKQMFGAPPKHYKH
ncbi:AraC family transcriptional regulator N-terminal domain-containing protein [Pseudoalteromonas haloplanktis]|uniref:AraC family transcriptional regulator N-terminal domain-containing protein n=1 Tax=Pseudoalteromonas haloplanktis TaxID=228 RepID=A0ABU1BFT5_PSEHA|nr:helix-turn-helix domain-containing protein [Pseudoalteromonas haloplanktis]MDQ9093200.1 AraC family transcriptional regulator N-terminal domain-containing protein [Pseudoalteromonas haloplanktis]